MTVDGEARSRFVALVPPPDSPGEWTSALDWPGIELDLGRLLPESYKDYVRTYGAGSLCGEIFVNVPHGPNPHEDLVLATLFARDAYWRFAHVDSADPFGDSRFYEGAVAWGSAGCGETMLWLADGAHSLVLQDSTITPLPATDFFATLLMFIDLFGWREALLEASPTERFVPRSAPPDQEHRKRAANYLTTRSRTGAIEALERLVQLGVGRSSYAFLTSLKRALPAIPLDTLVLAARWEGFGELDVPTLSDREFEELLSPWL